jgi:hypothetical protein
MRELDARREQPELRRLVVEASRALARLDAGRLEELALSCQLLNRDLASSGTEDRTRQAREAAGDMAVFARVLDVTRGNLNVINRLRELRAGRMEYGERPAAAGCGWSPTGSGHGDN